MAVFTETMILLFTSINVSVYAYWPLTNESHCTCIICLFHVFRNMPQRIFEPISSLNFVNSKPENHSSPKSTQYFVSNRNSTLKRPSNLSVLRKLKSLLAKKYLKYYYDSFCVSIWLTHLWLYFFTQDSISIFSVFPIASQEFWGYFINIIDTILHAYTFLDLHLN